jgi:murein DD-endopeptidase MepM/ murein hydrolase activator NlpD
MAESPDKKPFWEKFRHLYRLSIYRDETFEEVLNFRLTKLNVMAFVGLWIFLFLIIVISVIAYTPVRELIPGYPDQGTIRSIYMNNFRLDSLEQEIEKRDAYFENMRRIIAGDDPLDSFPRNEPAPSRSSPYKRAPEDSILRAMVAPPDQFSLSAIESRKLKPAYFNVLFFPPVTGMITAPFNSSQSHYGIDIAAKTNEVVKSTLPGTVIFAGWTLETGYVIQVQHSDNITSFYKHNAELLKRIGDRVKAGEPIAIIGNSGELTTGPHLHFELWHNGTPVNPDDYISF